MLLFNCTNVHFCINGSVQLFFSQLRQKNYILDLVCMVHLIQDLSLTKCVALFCSKCAWIYWGGNKILASVLKYPLPLPFLLLYQALADAMSTHLDCLNVYPPPVLGIYNPWQKQEYNTSAVKRCSYAPGKNHTRLNGWNLQNNNNICWPSPSNQGYQRGVGRPMMRGVMG